VVIAVLAVIWVVALTPMMLRKLSERRFSNSVDSFHRQLRGMRRAYPRLAAKRCRPGDGSLHGPDARRECPGAIWGALQDAAI